MKKLDKESRKWQFRFSIGKDYRAYEAGWRLFEILFIKLEQTPPDGAALPNKIWTNRPGVIKQFRFAFRFWLPIESY